MEKHSSASRTAELWARHEDRVWHAAFSPDGKWVVTASGDNMARLWLVYLGDLLELAESLLPVTLTPAERARMLER